MKKLLLLLLFVVCISFAAAETYDPSLKNYFPLNNNVSDIIGSEFSGSLAGDSIYETDFRIYNVSGNGSTHSMSGDGNADYINLDGANFNHLIGNGDDSFTLSFDFKIDSFGDPNNYLMLILRDNIVADVGVIIIRSGGTGVIMDLRNSTNNEVSPSQKTLEDPVIQGTWYNLVYRFDQAAQNVSLFINGTYQAGFFHNGDLYPTMTDIFLDGFNNVAATNGNIDNFKAYNRSLTQLEINNLNDFGNILGLESPPVVSGNISLLSPTDDIYYNSSLITFANVTYNISNFEPSICLFYTNETGDFSVHKNLSVGVENITTSVNVSSQLLNLTGVKSFYDFEESNGSIAIDKAIGNNGTINGAIYTSSKGGNETGDYALSFTTDYVQVPYNSFYSLGTTKDISISAWFKTTHAGDGDYHFIFDSRDGGSDGLFLAISSANTLQALLNTAEMQSTTTITDSNWHHVVIVWDRDDASVSDMYIDNVSENLGVISTSQNVATSTDVFFGRRSFSAGTYWEGDLDEIYIFNRTLSQNEVGNLYVNSLYYNFTEEIFNSTLQNISINTSEIQHFTYDFLPNNQDNLQYFINCQNGEDINSTIQTFSYNSDFTAPIVNIIVPPNNFTFGFGDDVILNASVSEPSTCLNNVSAFNLIFNNGTYYSWSYTNVTPHIHQSINSVVSCIDSIGNTGTDSVTFEIDTELPETEWFFPLFDNTSTTALNSSVLFRVEVSDESLTYGQCIIRDVNNILKYNFSANITTEYYSFQGYINPDKIGEWSAECRFIHTGDDYYATSLFQVLESIPDTTEPLSFGAACPEDLAGTIMFIFLAVLIGVLYFVCKFWIRYPFVTIVFSLLGAVYFGLALVSCSPLLGGLLVATMLILIIMELFLS